MTFVLRSVSDLSRSDVDQIFALAQREDLFEVFSDAAKGEILATIFFQPSTRTAMSFKSAFMRLGGNCIEFNDLEQSSAAASIGESLADTVRAVSVYCNLMVMRTADQDVFESFAKHAQVPIISAGHGEIEHPTTAINEVFTISKSLGDLTGIRVLVIAKLPKRTVHSLLVALSIWKDVSVELITPHDCRLAPSIESIVKGRSLKLRYHPSYSSFLENADPQDIDVIALEESQDDYRTTSGTSEENFVLTPKILSRFRHDVYVTHGLPRIKMLPVEIDDLPNAHYFERNRNGASVRAAIFLTKILNQTP